MKRKSIALLLALVLMIGAVAGTIAYLTSTTSEVENTFTVGKVKIVLDEAKVTKNDTTGEFTADTDKTKRVLANEYKLVMPGDTLPKDPTVTVLNDSADCYVRAVLTLSLTDEGIAAATEAMKDPAAVTQIKTILTSMMTNLGDTLTGYDAATWRPYGFGTYEALTLNDATARTMVDSLLGQNHEIKIEFWYKDIVPAVANGTDSGKNPADGAYTGKSLEPLFTAINVPQDLNEVTLPIFDGMTVKVVGNAIQAKNLDTDVKAWKAFDGVGE